MKHLFFITLITLSVGYGLLIVPQAKAQTFESGPPNSKAVIESTPTTPGPFTDVSLKYVSYTMDEARATLTWFVNGELKASGVGMTVFKLKTGPAGSRTVIQVKAEPIQGSISLTELQLRPAYATIVWEAQTYTPPFYKGKALASPGASIRYIAMPLIIDEKGQRIDPSKLMYKWMQNNREVSDVSGQGKRTAVILNDKYARAQEVSVEVSTIDNKIKAKAKVKVLPLQPFIVLYMVHPLLGIEYENALNNTLTLAKDEFTMIGEPYFYSVSRRDSSSVLYEWQMNGSRVSTEPSVTLRPQGASASRTNINLIVRHLTQLMQTARTTLSISLGAPETQGQSSGTYEAF